MEGETEERSDLKLVAVAASDANGDGGAEAMVVDGGGDENSGSGGKVKGPWSPEEDAILCELVSKFGARNWTLIARGIPGRSGKSCRLRWCNQLDPSVKRKPFSGKTIAISNSISLFGLLFSVDFGQRFFSAGFICYLCQ